MSAPVLAIEPSRNGDVTARYDRQIVRLDSKSGIIHQLDRAGIPIVQWEPFAWILDGRTEASEFLEWADDRAGSLSPFFVPTWQRDLVLAEGAGPTDTQIVIQKCGYTEYMFSSPARQWLAFILPDGAKVYRQVVGAEVDGDTEILSLDGVLTVAVDDTVMISFLRLARLATDEVEIAWHTREVAEVQLQFTELPKLTEVPARNRYRPTAYTFDDEPGPLVRGTWETPQLAFDVTPNPNTACIESVDGSSPLSTWSKMHAHTFEPFSTEGMVSIDVSATIEFLAHGNTVDNGFRLDVGLFDGIDNNEVHPPIALVAQVSIYDSTDRPRTVFTVNVEAAVWNAIADPTIRVFSWNTLGDSYSPAVQMKTYDLFVEPKR